MPITPIDRRSVPESVYGQLLSLILDREIGPGEPLPPERTLAATLEVSRPALREALQRLAHDGLLDVRHGEAAYVREPRTAAGVGLLRHLVRRDGQVDRAAVEALHELQRDAGPLAAAAAARRRDGDADRLRELAGRVAEHTDPVAARRLVLRFWAALADSGGNLARRLLANDLLAAQERLLDLEAVAWRRLDAGTRRSYTALVDHVVAGDGVAAAQAAATILRCEQRALAAVLDGGQVPTGRAGPSSAAPTGIGAPPPTARSA